MFPERERRSKKKVLKTSTRQDVSSADAVSKWSRPAPPSPPRRPATSAADERKKMENVESEIDKNVADDDDDASVVTFIRGALSSRGVAGLVSIL
jgi:hypothetical protein